MASKALATHGLSAILILSALVMAAPAEAQASRQLSPATEPHHATAKHITDHKGGAHWLAARRIAHRPASPGAATRHAALSLQKVVWAQNVPQRFCVTLACPGFIILGVGY